MKRLALLWVMSVGVMACDGEEPMAADAGIGTDAGPMEARDAGGSEDSGMAEADASIDDAGTTDAGMADAGLVDPCGDGVVQEDAGELCDDGNDVDTDGCLSSCRFASCGDAIPQTGVPQFSLFEDFEDGTFPTGTTFGVDDEWSIEADPVGGSMAGHVVPPGTGSRLMVIPFDAPTSGTLRFRWSVGQERFAVSVDGESLGDPSGDWRWQLWEVPLSAGPHELSVFCRGSTAGVFHVSGCWIDNLWFVADETADEACDDGNDDEGDGCTSSCEAT